MQRSPLNNITRILLWVLIGGAVMVWAIYAAAAIGSTLNGWRTSWVQEDITDNAGTCKRITAWPAGSWFIPSRTATEWTAFNTVAASKGFTITSCGVNGVCGGGANTCAAWSASAFVDNHCGTAKTWTCLGSGGGSNVGCSVASNSCIYPSVSNVNQQWGAWDVLYATCPAGTHIISGGGSPYYPGWGSCVGNWIYIWAYVYPGSSVQWGNGWTIDFYTTAADVPYYGDYNDMLSPDAVCGGWALTLTCEYD